MGIRAPLSEGAPGTELLLPLLLLLSDDCSRVEASSIACSPDLFFELEVNERRIIAPSGFGVGVPRRFRRRERPIGDTIRGGWASPNVPIRGPELGIRGM